MNDEKVSIIIPVYNSSKYIQETIQSIEKQTYKNYEAIFIDDNEQLLDVAVTKGWDVILMDRDNNVKNSKYKVIRKLKEID